LRLKQGVKEKGILKMTLDFLDRLYESLLNIGWDADKANEFIDSLHIFGENLC